MPNYNKITLIGHIGQDATTKEFESGTHVINFPLAVSEKWTGKDGQAHERTDWFNVEYFVKSTKVTQYLTKGTAVMVTGAMQSRTYEKDGEKRTAWAVHVQELKLIGRKNEETIEGDNVADIKRKIDNRTNANIPF